MFAGPSPSAPSSTAFALGPPTPSRTESAETSSTATFDRSTYIVRRLPTAPAMSPGMSARKSEGPSRQSTKFASIRPCGELKLVWEAVPRSSAATSVDSCPWRNATASGPVMARTERGARSQMTAASRAAASAVASGAGFVGIMAGVTGADHAGGRLARRENTVLKLNVSSI